MCECVYVCSCVMCVSCVRVCECVYVCSCVMCVSCVRVCECVCMNVRVCVHARECFTFYLAIMGRKHGN